MYFNQYQLVMERSFRRVKEFFELFCYFVLLLGSYYLVDS